MTARVNAGAHAGHGRRRGREGQAQGDGEIEKESTDKTGLRSDVVTLYQGGQYHLYTFKKYTDVRLVFAPEFDIAFFGGDPDNFEYPRYDLDVCFFRAYENGKPARPPHYLKWSKDGSKEGDLVFVAGHPGRTDRLNTVASLEYLRDVSFPFLLDYPAHDRKRSCSTTASAGPRRSASRRKTSSAIQNSRKARDRRPRGPARPGVHGSARPRPRSELRQRIAADPAEASTPTARPGTRSPQAQKVAAEIAQAVQLPRARASPSTRELFQIARDARPAGRGEGQAELRPAQRVPRLRHCSRSSCSSSPRPRSIPSYEEAKLAHSLAYWKKMHARRSRWSSGSSAGRSPEEAAKELVDGIEARRRRRPQEARRAGARRPSRAATTR